MPNYVEMSADLVIHESEIFAAWGAPGVDSPGENEEEAQSSE